MPWVIEESDDCGMHWSKAELPHSYPHFGAALAEASEIIHEEWRPPMQAFEQLIYALGGELVAHYWTRGIRIVPDHAPESRGGHEH